MTPEVRLCKRCGVPRPIDRFILSYYVRKDGTKSWYHQCKECRNKRQRDWERNNSEESAKQSLAYRKRNRFTYVLGCCRTHARRLGFEPCTATRDELKAAFTGKCDICGVPEGECTKQLHMDHDHATGEFRGFLCGRCNVSLGNFRDNPELLLKAAIYLERNTNLTEREI